MLVFVDVDTQNDFMNEDGALYVPKAENIKPVLRKLTEHAIENDILIIATADWHYGHEGELSPNGGPFPLHCMMNTPGAKKIKETSMDNTLAIPTDCAYDATPKRGQLVFQKQCYDVFAKEGGNNDLAPLLDRLGDVTAVVYGVATDYCVKAAVLGLLECEGVEKVYLVLDAIAGVDVQEGDSIKAVGEMTRAGAVTCTVYDVISGKIN